jgi:hypothetical protein
MEIKPIAKPLMVKTQQPVEKVGAELKVTTNRAPEAPRSPKYGVLGTHSGVEAGIEGVFQQAGKPLQHHLGFFGRRSRQILLP